MQQQLERTLSATDLTILVVGSVIGSGIFLVPGAVLAQSGGSVPIALAVWLVGGLLSLMGALSYGELGAMNPNAGGLYAYLRDAFGPFTAFLYGWTLFFVIGSGTVATLAVAAGDYLQQFVALTPLQRKAVAIAVIVAIMAVNVIGTRAGVRTLNASTALKVGGIVLMGIALLWLGQGSSGMATTAGSQLPATAATVVADSSFSWAGIGLSMVAVLWAYEGWQYATFIAGETKDPQRSVPRALAAGTLCLVALYVLANLGYLAALGAERMAHSDRVASEAVGMVLGPVAGAAVAVMIIVAMLSAAHGSIMTAARVYFAMSRDGLFFRALGEVHPRFGTPAFAVVASGLWSVVLAITGTFEQLLTYVVFIGWMFYALGAAAVIALRRKQPDVPRPFRVPGYPWTPILFILSAIGIVASTIVAQPKQSALGIGMVLLGAPAFLMWRARRRAEGAQRT
jgi:basic amino acid/polyamine antiporter, APA family